MSYPIEGADYWIRFMILPPKIFAFVYDNRDGTYLIFLDPRRDFDHQIDDFDVLGDEEGEDDGVGDVEKGVEEGGGQGNNGYWQ